MVLSEKLIIYIIIIIIILIIAIILYFFHPFSFVLILGSVIILILSIGIFLYKRIILCNNKKQTFGGINCIDINKKNKINKLLNFIADNSKYIPDNNKDEDELNNLLQSMDKNLIIYNKDSIREFNQDGLLLRYIDKKLIKNNTNLHYQKDDKYIFSTISPDMFKLENFELIGLNLNVGSHFVAYVRYENNWYKMDSQKKISEIIKYNKILDDINNNKSRSFMGDNLDIPDPAITHDNPYPTIYLYRNITNTKLKTESPIILRQFNNICYLACDLQLLMATDILDIDKNKEVQKK